MTKLVDGKNIRDEIREKLKEQVAELSSVPEMVVVYAGDNSVIQKFIELKADFAQSIGVDFSVRKKPKNVTTNEMVDAVQKQAKTADGVVVQLPLPTHLNKEKVLNMTPPDKDPDILSDQAYKRFKQGNSSILPPVVGAVKEVLKKHNVDTSNHRILVVGKGRLVGQPVYDWLVQKGADVSAVDEKDPLEENTKKAEMIISGAGSPHLITPDIITDGAILIDVGTSEQAGKVRGDIDPDCRNKANLFSPVPGGVGPITVAKLFENLVKLAGSNSKV